MERSERIRWKKLGGGSFRLANGKIVKPNEIFMAFENQIPKAFRFLVEPLDAIPVKPVEEVKPPELKYFVKLSAVGWYDVVNESGKVLNDKKLRKPDAEKLLESLK